MSKTNYYKKLILTMIVVLILSVCYNYFALPILTNSAVSNDDKLSTGKKIVTIWLAEDNESTALDYQVKKYNKENKDNIYIDLKIYKSDYDNLLKIALASREYPDIFEYSSNTVLVKNQIEDLSKTNINMASYGKDNFLYYNGKPYGMIFSAEKQKLLINKDLFNSAGINIKSGPKDWIQIQDYCKQLKEKLNDVTPLEFSMTNLDDLAGVVGESSVSNGETYPSMWNFKQGKYDFSKSKDILNVLKNMYSNNLINKDFDTTLDRDDLLSDFYNQSVGMIISKQSDDFVFKNFLSPSFNYISVDIPQFIESGKNFNYYYTSAPKLLVMNSKAKGNTAVEKVLQWLMDENLQSNLTRTGTHFSPEIQDLTTDGRNEYKYPFLDPYLYVNHDTKSVINDISSAIKGKIGLSETINNLNSLYKEDVDRTVRQTDLDINQNKEN